MSPFKENFKFDVVSQSSVVLKEEMPKFFLANTASEAEDIYEQFSSLLNVLAKNYSEATGIPVQDLFGEGLIGLGRAYRDWDPKRGGFRSYATFRIKDAIIEMIRDHTAIVKVPTNMRKAQAMLNRLKLACEQIDVPYKEVINDTLMPYSIPIKQKRYLLQLVGALIEYGRNAGTNDLYKFIEKLENLPEEVDFSEEISTEAQDRNQQMLEAALVVGKLKKFMDTEEIAICEGIMEDKTYEEIGKDLGKSKSWVSDKLKKLKESLLAQIKG